MWALKPKRSFRKARLAAVPTQTCGGQSWPGDCGIGERREVREGGASEELFTGRIAVLTWSEGVEDQQKRVC